MNYVTSNLFTREILKKHLKTKKHQKNEKDLCSGHKNLLTFSEIPHKSAEKCEKLAEIPHKSEQKPIIPKKLEIFECVNCNRKFKSKYNLTRHIERYCKEEREREWR